METFAQNAAGPTLGHRTGVRGGGGGGAGDANSKTPTTKQTRSQRKVLRELWL